VSEALVVVGMALAVYFPKLLPLIALPQSVTEWLRPWLRYVAPAVLGALIAPAILAPSEPGGAFGWRLLPFGAACVAAVLTRRMVPALAAGLVALAGVAALGR
jgi:branched-subunit amino acid transport protein